MLAAFVFCLWFFNPKVIFKRKFHFELPSSVTIMEKAYSLFYDALGLKIGFGIDDYPYMFEGMNNYVEKYGLYKVEYDDSLMESFRSCKWWDENEEETISAYWASPQGMWGIKTRHIFVLLTQNNEGQYFLHVYY